MGLWLAQAVIVPQERLLDHSPVLGMSERHSLSWDTSDINKNLITEPE